MEEGVLGAIKSMMDIVCLHLSDAMFDLVLKLVYEYATTNAKANAVRAFGQLISCLSRAQPEKTVARFLPFCMAQIKEELRHGASSVRTTSVHTPIPSDTTLHWSKHGPRSSRRLHLTMIKQIYLSFAGASPMVAP